MTPSFDPTALIAKYGSVMEVKYGARQIIFSQGDPADYIFYIKKGQAQLKVISPRLKEAVIAVVEAGHFCGEGCLVGESLRMSTAMAVTDCTVVRLEKPAVIRAIHDDLPFAEFFVTYVLNRSIRLRDDLVDHMFNSSERRLARVLLLLANYGREGGVATVINNANHLTLAKMVGTTRSRINFFMNKFRKLGYIDYSGDYNGGIRVYNLLLNVVLDDEPIGPVDSPHPAQIAER
jgi:CRP/FNR family transcriptional regulator, cyclic AMP receptor protein